MFSLIKVVILSAVSIEIPRPALIFLTRWPSLITARPKAVSLLPEEVRYFSILLINFDRVFVIHEINNGKYHIVNGFFTIGL